MGSWRIWWLRRSCCCGCSEWWRGIRVCDVIILFLVGEMVVFLMLLFIGISFCLLIWIRCIGRLIWRIWIRFFLWWSGIWEWCGFWILRMWMFFSLMRSLLLFMFCCCMMLCFVCWMCRMGWGLMSCSCVGRSIGSWCCCCFSGCDIIWLFLRNVGFFLVLRRLRFCGFSFWSLRRWSY